MNKLLALENLVKKYGAVTAVDGISFAIDQGICFGLLGPNGAGKTTAIEVIEDIIEPTSGTILYKGQPRSDAFREAIGIMFQQTALLSFLTVKETLQTFQKLYRRTAAIDDLIRLCRLQEFEHHMNDKISGGQRQRLLLAASLVNNPELLFLDEPSTGMDPQARRNLWDIVQSIKANGKTIVLTTHYMEEAQYLCDEIAILDHGKIIAQGTPEELIQTHCRGGTVILPRTNFSVPASQLSRPYREVKDRVEIETDNINACLQQLIALGTDLNGLQVRSPNLETVFLNLTGRQLRA